MTDCAAYDTHQSLPVTVDNEKGYVCMFVFSCNINEPLNFATCREDLIQMTDCAAYGTHQSLPVAVVNGEGYDCMYCI